MFIIPFVYILLNLFSSPQVKEPIGDYSTINEHIKNTTTTTTDITKKPCLLKYGKVSINGVCSYILSQGPCQNGFWVTVDAEGDSHCVEKPCTENGDYLFRGKCVHYTKDVCGKNEMLYVNFTGDAYCDCENQAFYDETTELCTYEHTKSNCKFGHYKEANLDGKLKCVSNPCLVENLVYNSDDEKCYKKLFSYRCNEDNFEYFLTFNTKDGTVECTKLGIRSYLKVPTISDCEVGSKRNELNNCRKVYSIQPQKRFRFRTRSRVKSTGKCHKGFRKLPNNRCINKFLGK